MKHLTSTALATITLGLLGSVSLLAHDMWIEPATFFPSSGQVVGVKLRVGEDLLGDPIARSRSLIHQFIVEDSAGRHDVIGREGSDPAGFIRASMPGLQVIGYRSNASAVDLDAAKFNQYLKEEGLENVIAARARRNETGRSVRELFSRHAKSLVLTGPASAVQADRALGFPLELVAEKNPYALRAGEELPVRLTYDGRPLAGALVVAFNRLNPLDKLRARSDADGRVRFNVQDKGVWLVKAVHMVPAPPDAKADWVSYWASLTFELDKAL
jgi:uncharacterized GH25 family protein